MGASRLSASWRQCCIKGCKFVWAHSINNLHAHHAAGLAEEALRATVKADLDAASTVTDMHELGQAIRNIEGYERVHRTTVAQVLLLLKLAVSWC